MELKANEIHIPIERVHTKIYIHTFGYTKKRKAERNSRGAQNSTPQCIKIIKYRKEASLQVANIELLL